MDQRKFNRISLITFFILAFALFLGRSLLPRFETHDELSIISWDVFGYYLYLPAYFIHHDTVLKDFTWVQQILDTYQPTIGFYQAYAGPQGEYIMKYTMGLSILYAPFFFTGMFFAFLLDYPVDGFSLPFQVAIAYGNIVCAIIGIWFFRKVLLKFFSDRVTALTMALVILGTNYFQLTAYDGAMPHNYLFTLFAIILWLVIRWHEEPEWKYSIPIGLLSGLAILMRPSVAVFLLVPILWGIHDSQSLKNKWDMIRTHYHQVIVAIAYLFLVLFLQMVYWRIHAGSFIYYSYDPAEKLQWISPYLVQVLFSFKKGWLIYAPLMIFALVGFYYLAKEKKEIFYASFLFFFSHLLIVASWPTWWYGGSLGQRAMMESYLVLALPLGFFLQWLLQKKMITKILFFIILVFFTLLNLFQTWQYMNFVLEPSNMTSKYYWGVFGRTRIPPGTKAYLEGNEGNDWEILKRAKEFTKYTLIRYDFENKEAPYGYNLETTRVKNGRMALRLDSNLRFSPGVSAKVKELRRKDMAGIRFSAWIFSQEPFEKNRGNLVITLNHQGINYKYQPLIFEKEKLKARCWNKISMDYVIPENADPEDILQIYIWYRGNKAMYVDDMHIELMDPKD